MEAADNGICKINIKKNIIYLNIFDLSGVLVFVSNRRQNG